MRDCQHPSWNPLSNGKVACAICGAVGSELRYIKLDDPQLDLEDTFTRMFALAEYWKNEALKARSKRGALSSTPAEDNPISTEPVAWLYAEDEGRAKPHASTNPPSSFDPQQLADAAVFITPLYAHPPHAHPSEDAKDAARYRWLRKAEGPYAVFSWDDDCAISDDDLDPAIDSAMQGQRHD